MEDFCKLHKEFLKQYFQLPNGIPSHDTFCRVFSALNPDEFQVCFIPELLRKLCIEGAIVTLDAMGCQREIAKQIVEQKGDYILRVKENQGGLLEEIKDAFKYGENTDDKNIPHYRASDEVNNDHGRIENRKCIVLPLMP